MNEFLVFMSDNWKWILTLFLSIVNILICSLRKRTKIVDSVKEYILKWLPTFIRLAEDIGNLSGEEKKEVVLQFVKENVSKNFDGIDLDCYIDFINDSIESILSTPQKKGA